MANNYMAHNGQKGYTVVLDAFQMDQVLWVAENLVRTQATARDSEANSMIAFWLVMIRQI